SDVTLADGGPLLELAELKVAGLRLDGARRSLRVEEVNITGPTVSAALERGGIPSALGFEIVARGPATPAPTAAAPTAAAPGGAGAGAVATAVAAAPSSSSSSVLPEFHFELGSLAWTGLAAKLSDRTGDVPVELTVENVEV